MNPATTSIIEVERIGGVVVLTPRRDLRELEFHTIQDELRALAEDPTVTQVVDFGRRSWVMAWLLGGLNFQVEHHLFPRICHVNYPAISGLVEATCREFGVSYKVHKSFWAGLASHFRWLRRMGKPAMSG